jgi:hypothetical protein
MLPTVIAIIPSPQPSPQGRGGIMLFLSQWDRGNYDFPLPVGEELKVREVCPPFVQLLTTFWVSFDHLLTTLISDE